MNKPLGKRTERMPRYLRSEKRLQLCRRCCYQWYPKTSQLPDRCPRCRASAWRVPFDLWQRDCLACGYRWYGGAKAPEQCAGCHSEAWGSHRPGVQAYRHTCQLCGYRWTDLGESPERCPECKGDAWKDFVLPWQQCLRCDAWFWSNKGTAKHRCIWCRSKAWDVSRARMPKPRVIKTKYPHKRTTKE